MQTLNQYLQTEALDLSQSEAQQVTQKFMLNVQR